MEFTIFHKRFFNAVQGSFSRVTEREYYDSQITLTDFETKLVVAHFGIENIHIGNVNSNALKASKPFLLFPSREIIHLNLVFPKLNKSELRLYLASKNKFKPKAGHIWFLYVDINNNLIIGSLTDAEWNSLDQVDDFDSLYQENIELKEIEQNNTKVDPSGKIEVITLSGKSVYKRDPRIAILRFQKTVYTCEVNPAHSTFIAQASRKPYVEAHHLIPMKFQADFSEPLDSLDNIVSLCPNCHRGIHHGIVDHKLKLIKEIVKNRGSAKLKEAEYYGEYYNCHNI